MVIVSLGLRYIVDAGCYQQRYSPWLDRVVFGSREIRIIDSEACPGNLTIQLNGYGVAVVEFRVRGA